MRAKFPVLPAMNLGKNFWISLGVCLWLYFVISSIPAVWAAYVVSRATGVVAMSGVSGTLWNGSASLASVKVKGMDHSLGQLTWKLDLLSFFTLKPCAKITTSMDNQQFDGVACVKRGGFILKDASISLPAPLLQPFHPLQIDGQFMLNIAWWEMQQGQLQKLHAKASWAGAKIFNGGNWMTLGVLGSELTDDGQKGMDIHLFDVSSPAHLDILGHLLYPSGVTVKGGVTMPEAFFRENNAAAWLSMFATQQSSSDPANVAYSVDLTF